MSSQNLISFSPVVNKNQSQKMEFFAYVVLCSIVLNSVNDWVNLGTLIKRHLGQPGHSRCLEMSGCELGPVIL
jgi:hypothetical protein